MTNVSHLAANHCAAPSEFCISSNSHTEISSLRSSNLKNVETCMKLHRCNPLWLLVLLLLTLQLILAAKTKKVFHYTKKKHSQSKTHYVLVLFLLIARYYFDSWMIFFFLIFSVCGGWMVVVLWVTYQRKYYLSTWYYSEVKWKNIFYWFIFQYLYDTWKQEIFFLILYKTNIPVITKIVCVEGILRPWETQAKSLYKYKTKAVHFIQLRNTISKVFVTSRVLCRSLLLWNDGLYFNCLDCMHLYFSLPPIERLLLEQGMYCMCYYFIYLLI